MMKSARVAFLLLYLPLVSLGAQTTNTPTIPGTTPSAGTPTAPAASTSQSGTVKPGPFGARGQERQVGGRVLLVQRGAPPRG